MRDIVRLGETAIDPYSEALSLIEKAASKFGRERLAGGNCGTFALALAMELRDKGFAPHLAFSFRDHGFDTIEEVIEGETDIYHVVTMLGDRMFDAGGETDANALAEIALRQYRDRKPGFFRDIEVDDFPMRMLIQSETAWSITTSAFRAAMVRRPRIRSKQ